MRQKQQQPCDLFSPPFSGGKAYLDQIHKAVHDIFQGWLIDISMMRELVFDVLTHTHVQKSWAAWATMTFSDFFECAPNINKNTPSGHDLHNLVP